MLRVNVGLSRKLSKDYNSSGFSVNIDGEVTASTTDAEAVMEQVKELFDLAEEALDVLIERTQGETAIASRDVALSLHPQQPPSQPPTNASHSRNRISPTNNRPTGPNANSAEEPATNKQINYLLGIGKRQRLSTTQLEKRVAEILERPVGLYDLTKQAAALVSEQLTTDASATRY